MAAMSSDNNTNRLLLQRFPALVLVPNTPKGRGVFAATDIASGTVIDISPVLIIDAKENSEHIEKTALYHYTYNWPLRTKDGSISTSQTQAVVFGLGSMFNHSTDYQNVGWTRDLDLEVIVYRTLRDVSDGEELCISYGSNLWFVDSDASNLNEDVEDADAMLARIDVEQ